MSPIPLAAPSSQSPRRPAWQRSDGRAIRYEDQRSRDAVVGRPHCLGRRRALPAALVSGSRALSYTALHVAVDTSRGSPAIGRSGASGLTTPPGRGESESAIDLTMGGVGMRRRRRDPNALAVGRCLRLLAGRGFRAGRRVRLAAEMKVPGRAWLEFEVVPAGGSVVHQTAVFEPVGLPWLAVLTCCYRAITLIFGGMLRASARRALCQPVSPVAWHSTPDRT